MDTMRRSSHRLTAALVLVAAFAAHEMKPFAQAPVDVYDLADYRLTPQVFEHFVRASSSIAEITSSDAAFTYAPLFTKDVALDGDAVDVASGLAGVVPGQGTAARRGDLRRRPSEAAPRAAPRVRGAAAARRSCTRSSYIWVRLSSSRARRTAEGWSVAVTNGASGDSTNCPCCRVTRNPGPSNA